MEKQNIRGVVFRRGMPLFYLFFVVGAVGVVFSTILLVLRLRGYLSASFDFLIPVVIFVIILVFALALVGFLFRYVITGEGIYTKRFGRGDFVNWEEIKVVKVTRDVYYNRLGNKLPFWIGDAKTLDVTEDEIKSIKSISDYGKQKWYLKFGKEPPVPPVVPEELKLSVELDEEEDPDLISFSVGLKTIAAVEKYAPQEIKQRVRELFGYVYLHEWKST